MTRRLVTTGRSIAWMVRVTSNTGVPGRRPSSCISSGVGVRVATSSVISRISTPRLRSWRSEEHTSELQSHHDLVCRLLLEKKKKKTKKKIKKKKKKKKKTQKHK